MSAHHGFGARTWRAPALIGTALVVIGLLFGAVLVLVLTAFPLPILAALLLVAGITHVRLLSDLRAPLDWSIAIFVGASVLVGQLLLGVILGLIVALVLRAARRAGQGIGR